MAKRLAHSSEATREAGARLRAARLAAGYASPIDFYERFDIKQGTYGNHEAGTRALDTATAALYAKFLGNVSAGWILTGEGEPPRTLEPKSPLGKRSGAFQAEIGGDPKEKLLDEKMLFLWGHLGLDIKIAALTLIESLTKVWPKRPT
jgi:hypothetical protein